MTAASATERSTPAQPRPVRRALSALVFVAAVISGCSSQENAVAPTARPAAQALSPATIGLTVRVLTRGAEMPVAGANVTMDDTLIGQTDIDGAVRATVVIGAEFHIVVSAAGFVGNGAWGAVASEERWTFYLERQL